MSAEQPPLHESELSQYPFKEVSFGHTLRNFDRDQAITYLYALQAGLVGKDTPVSFSPYQPSDVLADETVLAIEGIRPALTREDATRRSIGLNVRSFTNNPYNDLPAAAELHQAYNRKIIDKDTKAKLKDIIDWLKAVERGNPAPAPTTVRPEDLADFTKVFYAMKYAVERDVSITDKKAETMKHLHEIFEVLLGTGDRPLLSEIYADDVAALQEKQRQDYERLRQTIIVQREGKEELNPEYVTIHTTREGLHIVYLNVSDTDTESGAFGVVARAVQKIKGLDAHIVVLVDEEVSEDVETSNTIVKIKIPRNHKDDPLLKNIDLTELARRLNQSESLFGHGPEILQKTDFDGHPQVIGSPTVGTELQPKHVYDAVVAYFDVPRYSEKEFQEIASELAVALDCKTYAAEPLQGPSTEFDLAERSVRFNIPAADGVTRLVTLTETEIPLYHKVFTENAAANRAILLQKTLTTEAPEIVAARFADAVEYLETYSDQHDGERVLSVLADLNSASIRSLPLELRMKCLESIAASPTAIDQIWNSQNKKYHTIQQSIPDWIEGSPEQMQQARYVLNALPRRIDIDLVESVESDLFLVGNTGDISSYIETMQHIATSEEYKAAHLGEFFDKHLAHLLQLSLNTQINSNIRATIITVLRDEFGVEMAGVWRKIAQNEPELMQQIKDHYGSELSTLLPFIEEGMTTVEVLPDIIGGYEISADIEHIKQDLERQKAEGFVPIANMLVEVGRPIQELIARVGVSREEKDTMGKWRHEQGIQYAGIIKTTRLLRLDREHRDDLKVAEAFVRQLKTLIAQLPADVPVRVIRGGCPTVVITEIVDLIPEELKNRIIFCDINSVNSVYEDRKLRPLNATPLEPKLFT